MTAEIMTVDRLVAEVAKQRTGRPLGPTWATTELPKGLRLALQMLLDSFDYRAQQEELPAVVARVLAASIANLEDVGRALN